jgi:hypothetical protein
MEPYVAGKRDHRLVAPLGVKVRHHSSGYWRENQWSGWQRLQGW